MALKRVTMQDIADACALSRNTVSKVFNGRGAVQEATRRVVLAKARGLAVPIVWNTGGDESVETLQALSGLVCNFFH